MLRAAPRSSNRSGAMVPRPLQELQELEELSAELGKLLLSERAAALLRQSLELQARGDSGLLAAQAGATRMDTVHFGPPIAQPVDIDSRNHSHCFISDYLWSLIPHEW
ncbi:kinetochore protein Spc24 [Ara ararauna]